MSAYSNFLTVCPQDESVALHAAATLEALAEAFETFRDKTHLDALKDVHAALLDWEEVVQNSTASSGVDFSFTVTTEEQSWYIDVNDPQWVLDLRMSIFHGRLLFCANEVGGDDDQLA